MALPTTFARLRKDPLTSRVQDQVATTLTPIAQAVASSPLMGGAPVWLALELVPAFANIGGAFATAAYYKDSLFRVWVKGVLTCAAGCAAGTTIATMPAGLRPAERQRKAVEGNVATVQFISIAPTGVLTNEVLIGAGGSIDLDFSFLAEQ